MRTPFVAGNWKMNTTEAEAVALAKAVVDSTRGAACDVAVGVPFPHLASARQALRGSHVGLAAQDVYWEPKGAFTGQVSVPMLADYCQHVIIGHSERRQFFGETDDWVNKKLAAVLASTMDPIVCIGELLEERRGGLTEEVLYRQLRAGLAGHTLSARVTIAYEPVWAIGTGETATSKVAQEACAYIRGVLHEIAPVASGVMRIQYGGSVNAENAAELLSQPDIDGALVGGASLKADQFGAICAAAKG